MSAVVTIRPRAPADMDACVSALRRVHEHDAYPLVWPADPAKWLNGARQVTAWVAVQAATVCGHVAVARPRPDSAAAAAWAQDLQVRAEDLLCVTLLFVAPQARAHGTGGRLLDVALADIGARHSPAALEVISLNQRAIALYRARGWRQIGSVPYGWLPPGEQSLLFIPPGAGVGVS